MSGVRLSISPVIESTRCDRVRISGEIWLRVSSLISPASSFIAVKMSAASTPASSAPGAAASRLRPSLMPTATSASSPVAVRRATLSFGIGQSRRTSSSTR